MKSVALICFGKLKTPGFEAAVGEFSKRLQRYVDFKTYELKPLPVEQKSDAVRARVTGKESAMVLELIESKAFQASHGHNITIACLDESGKPLTTVDWSKKLEAEFDQGKTPVFLIGSGLGLGDELLKRASLKIGFGAQTFSHELARLVLVEQLYRATSYIEGHPYHNEG